MLYGRDLVTLASFVITEYAA